MTPYEMACKFAGDGFEIDDDTVYTAPDEVILELNEGGMHIRYIFNGSNVIDAWEA